MTTILNAPNYSHLLSKLLYIPEFGFKAPIETYRLLFPSYLPPTNPLPTTYHSSLGTAMPWGW